MKVTPIRNTGMQKYPIPRSSTKSGRTVYHVATKADEGDKLPYVGLSDADPRDDIRGWDSLEVARTAAHTYKMQRQVFPDIIVAQRFDGQWAYHDLQSRTVTRINPIDVSSYTDGGSW